MLFKNVATNPLPSQIPWNFLFAYYGPTLILFAVGYLFARYLFRWKRDESGVAAMSSSYSNLMLLGFPLAITAFGEDASLAVLVLLSSQSIILFPLTLTIFDFGLEDYSSTATQRRRIGRLILNPIVFSLALGLLFNGLEIQLQTPVLKTLDLFQKMKHRQKRWNWPIRVLATLRLRNFHLKIIKISIFCLQQKHPSLWPLILVWSFQ